MATISTTYRAIDEFSPAMKKMAESIGQVVGCMDSLDKAIASVDPDGLEDVEDASDDARESLSKLEAQAKKTTTAISGIERTKSALSVTGKAVSGLGSVLNTVSSAGLAVTSALAGMGGMAAKTSINFMKLYESSQIVFEQMLGSSDAAQDLYRNLVDIAKASTFPQESFLEAGRSLVGVGVSAEDTLKYLQAISDAVTGFGGTEENIERIAYAFRKVQTTGKIMMEDLNMMADGGINAVKILANQYGVTVEEMRGMITEGALPAEEALEKLTDGIENGTDGVNGMTQAMAGMSKAMKGKTITGALDSMNSSIRNFSLNLLGLNPTLEETDANYEENQKRIKQLTAALSTVNDIISGSTPVFKGMTDAVGRLLDKIIGANAVYDEASGKWQNVGGWLGKIKEYLETTDADKLKEVGDHILTIAVRAPMLKVAAKMLTGLGGAIEGLYGNWETLMKAFGKDPNAMFKAKAPQVEAQPATQMALPALPAAEPAIMEIPTTPVVDTKAIEPPALPDVEPPAMEIPIEAPVIEAAEIPVEPVMDFPATPALDTAAKPPEIQQPKTLTDLWKEDLLNQASAASGGMVKMDDLEAQLFEGMTPEDMEAGVDSWMNEKRETDPHYTAFRAEKDESNRKMRQGYWELAQAQEAGKSYDNYDLLRTAGEALERMEPAQADAAYSRYPGEWWRGVLEDIGTPTDMMESLQSEIKDASGFMGEELEFDLPKPKAVMPEMDEADFLMSLPDITEEPYEMPKRQPQKTALFKPLADQKTKPLMESVQTPITGVKKTLDEAWSEKGEAPSVAGYFEKTKDVILGESKKTVSGAAGPIGQDIAGLKDALDDKWSQAGDGGAVKRYFSSVSAEINPEGKKFKDQMADAFAMAIPQGNSLGEMIKSSLGNVATSVKTATGTVGGALKNLVPESLLASTGEKFTALKAMAQSGLGNLSGWFGEVGGSIATKVTAIFDTVANWPIVTQLTGALSSLGSVVGPVMSSITGLASSIAGISAMGILAVAGIGAVVGAFGLLNKDGAAAQTVTEFFNDFNQKVVSFKDRAIEGINGFVSQFLNSFPELVQRGSELIGSVVTGVLSAVPNLIVTGVEIVNNLITGFMTMLPELVTGGFTAIHNLIQGIKDGFPQFLESGKQMVISIKDSFEANLPIWIDKAKEAIIRFKDGLIENIPFLLEGALSMIQNLANFFKENFPAIVSWGTDMVLRIVDGLSTGIPWLLAQAWDLIKQLAAALWDHKDEILSAAGNIGMALIEGLMGGVGALWSAFTGWLGEKWNEILQGIKDFFGIASPSKVFSDIGDNLIQGLWDGITAKWEGFIGWFQGAWSNLTSMVSSAWEGAKDWASNLFGGGSGESVSIDLSGIEGAKAQIEQLRSDIAAILAGIEGDFAAMGGNVVVTTTTAFGNVAIQTATIVAGMGSTVRDGLSAIPQYFTDTMGQAADAAASAYESMTGRVTTQLNAMSTSVGAKLTELAAGVESKAEQMATGFTTSWQTGLDTALLKTGEFATGVTQKASTAVTGMLTEFGKLETSLPETINRTSRTTLAAVNSLVDSIGKAINTLTSKFHSAAVSMMMSLRTGIESQTSKVTDAVGTLVTQLKTKFEEGLGIHSPSDYMIWVGSMLLEGLMQGLSGSKLQSFIDSVIGDMQTSFEGGKFNADELVNYLDDQAVLDLIGKVSDLNITATPNSVDVPGIIQAAQQYIGYVGSDEDSIFGRRFGSYGAWCAFFVRAMAEEAGVPFPATGYVPAVKDWAMANGRWTQEPQAGYAVIFDWTGGGSGSHIGLVESVQGPGSITTIEGNTTGPGVSSGVFRKERGSNILGYVALDGGHGVGLSLSSTIQQAYNKKHGIVTGVNSVSGNVGTWRGDATAEAIAPYVAEALRITGQDPGLLDAMMWGAWNESKYDANAINNWDTNAMAGTPSKGLMQTIDSTFNAYKLPGHDDIWNPLDNTIASIRYMIARYGSVENLVVPRYQTHTWGGYATGTNHASAGLHWVGEEGPELMRFHGGETVIPNRESMLLANGSYDAGKIADSAAPVYAEGQTGPVTVNVSNTYNVASDVDVDRVAEATYSKIYKAVEQSMARKGSVRLAY